MKKAIIIGATGFGGLGLIEILLRHPGFTVKQLIARKDTGLPVSNVFQHLRGHCDMTVNSPDEIDFNDLDIAFFSTPDRAGMSIVKEFYDRGIRVIDFSGDFRFTDTDLYRVYAQNRGLDTAHLSPDLLKESVYGLPEKNASAIKKAAIVGNPGCFAVSMILGILPAVESGIAESKTIICDGKTGVSGAGKNSGEANLYPQRHENVNTYREGTHQHTVEVENCINAAGKNNHSILFIPQIVPLNRGILMTIYMDCPEKLSGDKLLHIYEDYYSDKPFVIVTDRSPNTADVRGSNRCIVRPHLDKRTGKVVIISAIDNLIKGQAGNAVQNANIMMGFDETEGLTQPAFYP